jgi:hypothetical protein
LALSEVSGLTKPRLGRHGKAPSPWGEGWGEGARSVLKCLAWNGRNRITGNGQTGKRAMGKRKK